MTRLQKLGTSIVIAVLLTWGLSYLGVRDDRPVDGNYTRGLPLYVFIEGSGYGGPTSPHYVPINIAINFIIIFALTSGVVYLKTKKKKA